MSPSPFTDRFGSQHTLKPVYFSIEVLERYFDDPKYLVFYSDYRGSICLKDEYATDDDYEYIRDFGLAYKEDDTNERAVVTFLGDMLKLPYKAQCYWYSYLLDQQDMYFPNEGFVTNLIRGEWVDNISIFQALTMELHYINEMCMAIGLPGMFREEYPSDSPVQNDRPNNYHVILLPTEERYYNFVITLEKMTTSNINIDTFLTTVQGERYIPSINSIERLDDQGKPKGSVTMLVEWFKANVHGADIDKDIKLPLRELIKQRQTPAHVNYPNKYDKSIWTRQNNLIQSIYVAIRNIRLLLANHPKAKSVKVPDVLFDGEHIAIY